MSVLQPFLTEGCLSLQSPNDRESGVGLFDLELVWVLSWAGGVGVAVGGLRSARDCLAVAGVEFLLLSLQLGLRQ